MADIVAPEYLKKAKQFFSAKLAGKNGFAYDIEIVTKTAAALQSRSIAGHF